MNVLIKLVFGVAEIFLSQAKQSRGMGEKHIHSTCVFPYMLISQIFNLVLNIQYYRHNLYAYNIDPPRPWRRQWHLVSDLH